MSPSTWEGRRLPGRIKLSLVKILCSHSPPSLLRLPRTVAALQLVERQLVTLDADVGDLLKALGRKRILVGWNADGSPIFQKRPNPITLHQLSDHSSEGGIDFNSRGLMKLRKFQGNTVGNMSTIAGRFDNPLLFGPGECLEYGSGVDWVGRIVEQISGIS